MLYIGLSIFSSASLNPKDLLAYSSSASPLFFFLLLFAVEFLSSVLLCFRFMSTCMAGAAIIANHNINMMIPTVIAILSICSRSSFAIPILNLSPNIKYAKRPPKKIELARLSIAIVISADLLLMLFSRGLFFISHDPLYLLPLP